MQKGNSSSSAGLSPQSEAQEIVIRLERESKLLLQKGEDYLQRAKSKASQNEDLLRRYTATKQKLQIIFAEIQKQIGVIKRLMLSLRHKNQNLCDEIEKVMHQARNFSTSLTKSLDQLKQKSIHPSLLQQTNMLTSSLLPANISNSKIMIQAATTAAATSSTTSNPSSLYDFVNISSLIELQKQAEIAMHQFSKILQSAKIILDEVEKQYNNILTSSNTLMSNMNEVNLSRTNSQTNLSENSNSPPQPSSAPQKISSFSNLNAILETSTQSSTNSVEQAQTDLKTLGSLVLSIATFHDKTLHILTNTVYLQSVNQQDLETQFSQIENGTYKEVEQLYENIVNTCNSIETRYKKFSEFYKNAMKTYEALEFIAPSIPDKVVQLDELQTLFLQTKMRSASLFEEIRDLSLWYEYFDQSYDNLLLEVKRRNAINNEHQKIVNEMKKKLQEMYEEEEKKRLTFFEEFGRFLPQSLCPSILESTTKFTIYPSSIASNLPKLDSTHSVQIEGSPRATSKQETTEEPKIQ